MSPTPLRLVAFGECMIELRTEKDTLMRQSFGGDTLNTAIYLARLAGRAYSVSYATAVGASDPYSLAMVANWEADGIDSRFVTRREGELPGLYAIRVDQTGERHFSYWRNNSAARRYFEGRDTPLERSVGEIDVLYLSGISLAILPPSGRERLFAVAAELRAQGKMVVFDNNFRHSLWTSMAEARASYAIAYALADIALLTLGDEMELEGQSDEKNTLHHILARGSRELVIKRGARSTLVRGSEGHLSEVMVKPVANVVDTTAAGDSFAAGYLGARLHGRTPVESAEIGNRLAAAVITHPGAIIPVENMPPLQLD